MQAISLNAQALEVAKVSLMHEVLRDFSQLHEPITEKGWAKDLTAQTGSPDKTEAVTEARGTDAVIFGSKDQTIVENAATVKRAVDELNMVSKREKFMKFS